MLGLPIPFEVSGGKGYGRRVGFLQAANTRGGVWDHTTVNT